MRINDFPKNTIKVLLLPPFKIYKERLKERNKKFPYKRGQNAINKYFSINKSKYDIIYNVNLSIKDLINKIIKLIYT